MANEGHSNVLVANFISAETTGVKVNFNVIRKCARAAMWLSQSSIQHIQRLFHQRKAEKAQPCSANLWQNKMYFIKTTFSQMELPRNISFRSCIQHSVLVYSQKVIILIFLFMFTCHAALIFCFVNHFTHVLNHKISCTKNENIQFNNWLYSTHNTLFNC